jgi:cytochrome bd-type quinol oxidase subunit 1
LDALALHRIHFGFTITYHYLFPQLTMGLALLIVVLKTIALRSSDPQKQARYDVAARFWAKIFAINFLLGVVTGIPMEFQFGTNWSEFSRRTGGVIGMPLAMEGIFSFFLESAFLGLFLFGEKRLSVTNAWMQHPVGYRLLPNGVYEVSSFTQLLLNPWAWLEYTHNMCAAVVTASFVMAAVGALYILQRREGPYGHIFLKLGVYAGIVSSVQGTQLFDLRHHVRRSRRPRPFPPRPMALHAATLVLQLPHHGRPRDVVWPDHGHRGGLPLARQARVCALDPLVPAAQLAATLHRHHGRLDDR